MKLDAAQRSYLLRRAIWLCACIAACAATASLYARGEFIAMIANATWLCGA